MTPNERVISGDASKWEYVPGLLELMEEGLGPEDLGSRDFVAPQVRGIGFGAKDLSPERSQLERIWDWLRGFRRGSTLCERDPIWVPIAHVWAAPGGRAEFTYGIAAERELRAEITVFPVAGLGGASRRNLTSAVRLDAAESGAAYDTRAYLTVYHYTKQATGESLYRVDVDCAGEFGEFRSYDLDPRNHPFAATAPSQSQLRDGGYVIIRLERCGERTQSTDLTLREETLRIWKFDVSSKIPGIDLPFKLGATCQHTRAFETKFTLPGGRDYAFCAARGEAPVVPLCIALAGR